MKSGMRAWIRAGNSVRGAMVATALAGGLLGGCNTAPPGDTGGVIGARERTRVDAGSSEADTTTLLEFADRVGQELGAQLARIPEVKNSPTQVIIEMGGIQNMTRTPSSDFAAMQRRVFLTLQRSDLVRENAQVRERYDRVARDAVNLGPESGATLPGSAGGVQSSQVGSTFLLQGTFSELSRGGYQGNFLLDFTLTKADTRAIVYSNQFDFKQLR